MNVYDLTGAAENSECGLFFDRRAEYQARLHEANEQYNGKEFAAEVREILTDWWMLRRTCHAVWFVRPFVSSAKLMDLAQADGLFEESEQESSWGKIKAASVAGILE